MMVFVFLLVGLSSTLTLDGLTLSGLLGWFNSHPFISIFLLECLLNYTKVIEIKFKKDKEIV